MVLAYQGALSVSKGVNWCQFNLPLVYRQLAVIFTVPSKRLLLSEKIGTMDKLVPNSLTNFGKGPSFPYI